jgi:hypothetical protein
MMAPDTPAFRRWFGDSKVVDSRGRPLVVYHGGALRIETFAPGGGTALLGKGIYFTREHEEAEDYARRKGGGLYSVFLRVERPFIRYQSTFGPRALDMVRKHLWRGPGSEGYVNEKLDMLDRGSFLPDNIPPAMLTSLFQADGYDGVFDGRHICVFDPRQIKSATDNVGTFDRTNPSILQGVQGCPPCPPRYVLTRRR